MRFGQGFEYIDWIRTFKKHNISFNYEIMSDGLKFKWREQSKAYKYVRDLCSELGGN